MSFLMRRLFRKSLLRPCVTSTSQTSNGNIYQHLNQEPPTNYSTALSRWGHQLIYFFWKHSNFRLYFSLTKDQAHDLVFRLNPDERKILAQTLSMFQSNSEKTQLEGKRKFWWNVFLIRSWTSWTKTYCVVARTSLILKNHEFDCSLSVYQAQRIFNSTSTNLAISNYPSLWFLAWLPFRSACELLII